MPRHRRDRKGRQLPSTASRETNFRSHWRADGAPKKAYPSQREALSVADERRQESGVLLTAYSCEVCSAWHLANRDRWDR
jgi:hypothetical protein